MSVVENASKQLLSSGSWQVDPVHSAIEFRVKHMVIETVKGRFCDFDGAVVAGAAPSVRASIRAASLDTLHEERDEHLRDSKRLAGSRDALERVERRVPEELGKRLSDSAPDELVLLHHLAIRRVRDLEAQL